MITADRIRTFIRENNLRISPLINIDRMGLAIDKNGGTCLWTTRKCPCKESIAEIKEMKNPEMACCKGEVICDSRYEKEMTTIDDKINNTELREAIEALDRVEGKLKEMGNGKIDEIPKKITEAIEIIEENLPKHKCGDCSNYMAGMADKLAYMGEVCESNPISCGDEHRLAVEQVAMMKETFRGMDKDENEDHSNTEEKRDFTEEKQSKFHTCMSNTSKSLPEGITQPKKLCISSKVCSGKMDQNEAMRICLDGGES
jgi:hypothetical protein